MDETLEFDRIVTRNFERLFTDLDDFHYDNDVSTERIVEMLARRTGDLDEQYSEWVEEGED